MKHYIFASAIIAATTLASCEDMLAPESDMVIYEEDHTISSVNDTLFSVMGVVHLMQQVADRTNLLGEVRADLVSVTPAATTDLQALAQNLTSTSNIYNRPEDYYAIVNNCNYFIQNADTAYSKNGQKVFERELAVMHTFRAWAYLQLVTIYGNIPFYTHFLGTQAAANDVMNQPRQDLQSVCNWLIDDLKPYIGTYELDYGAISFFQSAKFFIPVRVMLGELCLWAGRYDEAAQYYHDYLANLDDPKPTSINRAYWSTSQNPPVALINGYSHSINNIDLDEVICYIPMETNVFDGTVSTLNDLYCSTEDNDYYYQLTWSEANVRLSAAQSYYFEYEDALSHKRDTVYLSPDSALAILGNDRKLQGDLRLFAVTSERSVAAGNKYNDTYQTINKFSANEAVILYRISTIYLHFAEALNRAGFPSAAFAVLKYGLSNETLVRNDVHVIAPYEREKAGTLLSFREADFYPENTVGIHSHGSGDAPVNPEYILPMPSDTTATPEQIIAYQQPLVEDLIIDELALETCFEGQRFFDLLRVALRRSDPAYLADRIARRNGSSDDALRARLMEQQNWYLPMK